MNKILFLLCGLTLLLCCNRTDECNGIKNNQYNGYGIVFYHMPVSGGNYEIIIIPICGDTSDLIVTLKDNIKKVKILEGVSCSVNIRNTSFNKVFGKSQKINLINNNTLAPQYRMVYVCPVYIEFKDAQNVTRTSTGNKKNTFHEKFIFESKQQLMLKYFLSNNLRVINLRVL